MLILSQLQSFFELNAIPLEGSLELGKEATISLFAKAMELGYSFGSFALVAIINAEHNGIETHFASYDELYEAYCCFTTGLLGAKC
jgi:hypothetical protein